MKSEKDKYIEERYAEYQKKWAENPPQPPAHVAMTDREEIPVHYNVAASAFDFEEKEGHTTYEVVGHFNSNRARKPSSENLANDERRKFTIKLSL